MKYDDVESSGCVNKWGGHARLRYNKYVIGPYGLVSEYYGDRNKGRQDYVLSKTGVMPAWWIRKEALKDLERRVFALNYAKHNYKYGRGFSFFVMFYPPLGGIDTDEACLGRWGEYLSNSHSLMWDQEFPRVIGEFCSQTPTIAFNTITGTSSYHEFSGIFYERTGFRERFVRPTAMEEILSLIAVMQEVQCGKVPEEIKIVSYDRGTVKLGKITESSRINYEGVFYPLAKEFSLESVNEEVDRVHFAKVDAEKKRQRSFRRIDPDAAIIAGGLFLGGLFILGAASPCFKEQKPAYCY